MKEFILEHWQLIASLVLAVFNLVVTLLVHRISSARISSGSAAGEDVRDTLLALVKSSSAILEVLNAKENQQKGE